MQVIAALVAEAEHAIGHACTVGIGMPGTISPATGLVKNANSTWLNGRPLHEDLEARLDRPVRLANDANCFALSEASDGAAAGASVVFGVIIGTGCGGGVVVQRRRAARARTRSPANGATTRCRGPTTTSGRAPSATAASAAASRRSSPALASRATTRSTREWQSGASTPRESWHARRPAMPQAAGALDRYAHRVARGLATIVNVLDPDVIVLGGGMSNVPHLYDAVPRQLPQFVFSDAVVTRIVPPKHGDSSGVRGAAWLWSLDEARAITGAARAPRAGAGTAGA